MTLAFLGIFTALVLPLIFWPWPYTSEMKLLVRQERVNPLVTSADSQQPVRIQGVTEQDLNSEVELIKSHDLLKRVVVTAGLHERPGSWMTRLRERLLGSASEPADSPLRLERAALALRAGLSIEPINKTSLIRISYGSPDPQLSARVLRTLGDLYMEKHLESFRPAGMLEFLDKETERYRTELDAARARVAEFQQSKRLASAPMERDAVLQEVSDLTRTLSQTDAALSATTERVANLEGQLASTPARTSTESRESSARLQEIQGAKLLDLELKRLELARVFQPSYPPLLEVEQQLAATRDAIAQAKRSPIREEATDVNPTYAFLTTELAKARSELGGLQAQQATVSEILAASRERALRLERLVPEAHDLDRDFKVAEANYLAYDRKREEARISDALDTRGIVNVAVSDAATVPLKPSRPPRLLLLLIAGLVAAVGSVGVCFVADVVNPSFRSSDEVYALLNVPVITAWESEADDPSRRLTDGS